METHTSRFRVRLGLFIAVGFGLFIIAIFLIGKQKNLFNPVFKLTATFKNVSGLEVGSNIRFSGINVGTVDTILISDDSTVQVGMLIRKNVRHYIKVDCEAGIGSSGIIGDRILSITQGTSSSPTVEDGQQIASKEPIETDAIMEGLKTTADNAVMISQQVSEITTKINTGNGTLSRLIHDSVMAQNINQAITNLNKGSKGLTDITTKINSGNGALSKLINDPKMARNVDQTVVNLRKASKGLSENMEAAKDSFLLRGSYRRKAKAELKAKNEAIAIEQKAAQKNKEGMALQSVEPSVTTTSAATPLL